MRVPRSIYAITLFLTAGLLLAPAPPAEAARHYDGRWSGSYACKRPDGRSYTFNTMATVRGNEMTLISYFTGRHIIGGRTDEVREKQTGTVVDSGHVRLRGIAYNTNRRNNSFTFLEGQFEGESFEGKATRWKHECTVTLIREYSPIEEERKFKAEEARKAEEASAIEIARLKQKAEEARLAEVARKAQETEAEKLRAAEIAWLKQEVEKQRKTGSQLTEGGARELKARMAEIARLRKEVEQRQETEKVLKAREAEVEKARAAEMVRMKREIEKARKARETEIARLKQEAEKARQARETEIARLRKALKERADGTGGKSSLSDLSGVDFGRYHALVIGIEDYKYLPKLKTAVADSVAVARVLKNEYGFKVTLLLDPDHSEIIDAFDDYRERLGPQDNLLIYYAGHGWLDEEVDQGYWLPVNAKSNRRSQWVSNATITDTLKGLAAKHVMVVADSCYSGTLVRGADMGPRTRTGNYWKRMAEKWARVAITSGGLEPVADKGGGNHSPFAKAFIDALKDNKTIMDGTQLFSKLRRPVMVASEQVPQYADVRGAGHDGGDFLFVRKK